ncbi:hypothetical protein [Dongshaea marina]|uniref:hypothetical protein n=1 Tax=Dongshaea marina TaxID=2047966 RepID=UPI000D3E8914|nr:hypothetical protein [Dongshaea marina]
MLGGYYRDLNNKNNIDSFAGLRYASCCWAVTFTWEDQLKYRTPEGSNQLDTYKEVSLGINFELLGMGSGSVPSDFKLGTSQLPYYRPFDLETDPDTGINQ